jgi:hypothetical protein
MHRQFCAAKNGKLSGTERPCGYRRPSPASKELADIDALLDSIVKDAVK